MSKQKKPSEQTNLTPEDYKNFIRIDNRWIIIMFTVVFGILSGTFYWYSITSHRHSNLRVDEAKYILDRADTAPREITPLTLELEELVAETARDRDRLLEILGADRQVQQLETELEQRFLQQTFHFELPDNWREQIPDNLDAWYAAELESRREALTAVYAELGEFIDDVRSRVTRGEEIKTGLNTGPGFAETIERYETSRDALLTALDRIEKRLQTVTEDAGNGVQISPQLFDALVELPNLITRQKLQYRRFSALTAAPAGYLYAERYLRDALRIFPKNSEALYQLGRVYEAMELPVIAAENYARAIKVNPEFERTDQIIERFRQRVEETPENSRARYDLAFALHESGQPAAARQQLEEVLQLEAGEYSMVSVLAEKRLGYIDRGVSIYNRMSYF